MSGGTWDYAQHNVSELAHLIRSGKARWADDDSQPLDLPASRAFVADLLDLAAALVKELDWHHAGDTHIADDEAWRATAVNRIQSLLWEHL